MYNEDIVEKIIGNKQKGNFNCEGAFNNPIGNKGLGRGFGFGQGECPIRFKDRQNFNVNPNRVIIELQKVLDRLPEVKNAKGTIKVEFTDGKMMNLDLKYNE